MITIAKKILEWFILKLGPDLIQGWVKKFHKWNNERLLRDSKRKENEALQKQNENADTIEDRDNAARNIINKFKS